MDPNLLHTGLIIVRVTGMFVIQFAPGIPQEVQAGLAALQANASLPQGAVPSVKPLSAKQAAWTPEKRAWMSRKMKRKQKELAKKQKG